MKRPIWAVLRTTTFRLAMVNAAVLFALAAALVAYLYWVTAGQAEASAQTAAEEEYRSLVARSGAAIDGVDWLNIVVIERAAAGNGFLYLLANRAGDRISGNITELPQEPERGMASVGFRYQVGLSAMDGSRRARGVVGRLADGRILLVARDLGDAPIILSRASIAIWLGGAVGLMASLAAGMLLSRAAARRAEALARTAEAVMGGDLARRAPVTGAGDEYDALASRLNAMLDEIERLLRATREAGDAIAHDLRSPLTRLKSRLEQTIAKAPGEADVRAALVDTSAEMEGLLATFDEVLRLSRLEAIDPRTFPRIDLADVAREMADLYGVVIEETGFQFSTAIEDGLFAKADRGLLSQALSNLIDNALKYTPEGGHIRLEAKAVGSRRAALGVVDNGPGIAPGDRARAVERFVRLVDPSRTEPGSGLGLSLAKGVAERHGGVLELADGEASVHGPGLRAEIVLPLAGGHG